MLVVHGQVDGHLESPVRARPHSDLAAEPRDPLSHSVKPVTVGSRYSTNAEIVDPQPQGPRLIADNDIRSSWPGMLERVGQRFLDDAIRVRVNTFRQRSPLATHGEPHRQAGLLD